LVELTKIFKRVDLKDEFYILQKTLDADGSLQQTTSPAPLYLLDCHPKVLVKQILILLFSFASIERTITFRILNGLGAILWRWTQGVENIMNVPEFQRVKPLLFKIIMNIITSKTD